MNTIGIVLFVLALQTCLANGQWWWWGQHEEAPTTEAAEQEQQVDFINSGQEAKSGQFPYVASLLYNTSGPSVRYCIGSIINDRWLVTVARCLKPNKPTQVGVGNVDWPLDTKYNVALVVPHSGFDKTTAVNDIGLVKTKVPMVFGASVKAIQMATAEIADRSMMTIIGWGDKHHILLAPLLPKSRRLNYANVLKMSITSCAKKYKIIINDRNICTLKKDAGACQIDIGGPLVNGGKLYGMLSAGIDVCFSNNPNVFTKVSSYAAWIAQMQLDYSF